METIINRLLRPEFEHKKWFFPAEALECELQDLSARARYFATELDALGIQKGDRVGLVNSNSSDLVALLFACWWLGAVAVPLKTQGGKFQRLEAAIQRCHAVCDFSLLILDDDIRLPTIQQSAHIKTIPMAALQHKNSDAPIPEPTGLQADDLALIQFYLNQLSQYIAAQGGIR